jgi:phosphodiesterase/alkaline phosphatase D-like protein
MRAIPVRSPLWSWLVLTLALGCLQVAGVAQVQLAAPTLTAPAAGAINVSRPVHLAWSAVTDATNYTVQIATSETFTSLVATRDDLITTALDVTGLTANTRYFWRILATSSTATGYVTGPWSTARSFTTAPESTTLTAPTLTAPLNQAVSVARPVTLRWTAVTGAARYYVQLSTTETFATSAYATSVTTTSTTVTALLANTRYFWRVCALTATTPTVPSAWSTVWDFTTSAETTTLPAPILKTPVAQATNVVHPVVLSWKPVTGAARYQVQVATAESFATLAYTTDSLTTTTTTVTSLLANTRYFWRVRALTAATPAVAGAWSIVWSFTTAAESATLPAPILIAPANQAVGVARTVVLSWGAVTGAARYHAQLATAETFATPIFTADSLTSTSTTVTGLLANTRYFWRVRAINAATPAVASAWSTVWSFTTAAESPALPAPILTAPANQATSVARPVVLSWTAVTGAARYYVQVATVESFATLVHSTDSATATSVSLTGLLANTRYFWRVRAINAATPAVASAWSTVWSFTTAAESPALPAPILTAPANQATSVARPVVLSWTAVTGAARYYVQVTTVESFATLVHSTDSATATSVSLTGLLANTRYFWRVRAINAATPAVASAWSTVWSFTTAAESATLPAPILTAPANQATNVARPVTLSWTAVTGAARYYVQVATVESFATLVHSTDSATATSVSLTGLLANTRYFWRVRAINAATPAVASAWSTVWSFTTAAESAALPAPILTAPANLATNVARPVVLSWTAVTGAARYYVQVTTVESFATLVHSTDSATATSATLTGLLANTRYFWRVRAINAATPAVASAWSTVWSFTTAAESATLPAPILTAPANQATNVARPVTLSWTAVTGAARYYVQVTTVESFATLVHSTDSATATSVSLTGLLANTRYFWRVRAINAATPAVASAWSTVWSFTTAGESPALPAPILTAPANLATNVARPVVLSWTAVTGAARYYVQVATVESFATLVHSTDSATATSVSLTGLLANTRYFWRVRAINAATPAVASAWSTVWSFTTAAESPALPAPILTAPANQATSVARTVTLRWTAVTGAARYYVQLSTMESFATPAYSTSLTTNSATVTSLLANTRYFWRVCAVTATTPAVTSAWSAVWSFTTAGESATLPAPILTAPATQAINVARPVVLRWTAVTGAARYYVQLSTVESFATLAYSTDSTTATSATVSSLSANTRYFWRVRAINAATPAVASAWSPAKSFTTAAQ